MSRSKLTQATPAYHHLKHPGGRLTKIGGQAVSLAPQLGQAIATLGTSVSRIAIGAAMVVTSSGNAANADCDPVVAPGPQTYLCSGDVTTTQSLGTPIEPLIVNTAPGFSINTVAGNALNLFQDLGGTFNDAHNSEINGNISGVFALQSGIGALSITTTGTVTGTIRNGIDAFVGIGTNLTVDAATVSGGTNGISAFSNNGSGALSVTSTGTVTGTSSRGIYAYNAVGTSLSITAVAVSGGTIGIEAKNRGSGALAITTTGSVTGTTGTGIDAFTNGTGLTVSALDVTGRTDGINASSLGSGAVSITSTGAVTGTTGRGIVASASGADLNISAVDVTGASYGITASKHGSGDLSISATGTVTATGATGTGIGAYNSAFGSTSLTINAATVSGARYGIDAINYGSGALSITATDAVTATGAVTPIGFAGTGIDAFNNGTDLTINAAAVSGEVDGIGAYNLGSGALSVTATGAVSGGTDAGIDARNSGTGLTIDAAAVSGGNYGIVTQNRGTGATSVTATGPVVGTSEDGIRVYNSNYGAGLTVEAAAVSGGTYGVHARNYGSGALSITTTGDVIGTSDHGISSRNYGTYTTIAAAAVSGGSVGIYAGNLGSGVLSVTATDDVTATGGGYWGGIGIRAHNFAAATDITIATAAVSGAEHGIVANNDGSGALTVTTTGDVTGTNEIGIMAHNRYNRATDLTIQAATVHGGRNGIYSRNDGSGALSVTATGDVTATISSGISAMNSGTNLSVQAATVTGGNSGIVASNFGSGALSVAATGDVTGTNNYGIYIHNSFTSTDSTVNAASVSGLSYGIVSRNYGIGALSVTATGQLDGANKDGVFAVNSVYGTDLTVAAAGASGANYGISVRNYGAGSVSVTASGDVTGTEYHGIAAVGYGTDLTISSANVSGGFTGIGASNFGSGAMSVTATGDVTGTRFSGVYAHNSGSGTDLTINAATVSGGNHGIFALNNGTGALALTATGDVTGTSNYGIEALNVGTDLTVNAASATGQDSGIRVLNIGTGAVTVTATGTVTGTDSDGIYAYNSPYGSTDLTIHTADVSGGRSGIKAENFGSGALTITATGEVTGETSDGINGHNHNGTDFVVAATSATGSTGISVRNDGRGALSVTATGSVTGTGLGGIYAGNTAASGTDLTISSADVTGSSSGISAFNNGTGTLSVTSTGTVLGANNWGIQAINMTGTNLSVVGANVSGLGDGIEAFNFGSGNLFVAATGDVTGTNGTGIAAHNAYGTDLNIEAHNVSGDNFGIHAHGLGSGVLSITTTGNVESRGEDGVGLVATNGEYGTDLAIEVNDVYGDYSGIRASNYGTGALSITATGDVEAVGANGIGLLALNNSYSTDLTADVNNVYGGRYGISAVNRGGGAIVITATGNVEAETAGGTGITASNQTGTDLTIETNNVYGDNYGIQARNSGSGALSVTAIGSVKALRDYGVGIHAFNLNGTDLTVDAHNVSGGESGIRADNLGSGATDLTVSGTVTGGTGVGIYASAQSGATASITLNAGADVSSGSGLAIVNNESDSITTLNAESKVTGNVQLADGSDELLLAGGDVSDVTLFDGGDDSSTADGFIDTVRITGTGYDVSGSSFSNWENFSVEGGSVTFNDTALTIGDGSSETGVSIVSGGMLTTGANFTLNAPLSTSSGGIFNASGSGAGAVTVFGDVSNDGVLSSQDGSAGDVMTITGDYSGSGTVALDAVLSDDASSSDMLVVLGDASGAGVLDVANAGGSGEVTSLGIDVISVAGASVGQFTLAGDYETDGGDQAIVAGAYAYTLVEAEAGRWRLQSELVSEDPVDSPSGPLYQPGSPVYESLAQNLLILNGTHSLRSRGGSQDYLQTASASGSVPVQRLSSSATRAPSPFWIEMGYDDIKWEPGTSTTGATSDSSVWEISAGADSILNEGETGFLVGGVIINYAKSNTKVVSQYGSGSIDSSGTGVTLAATWYDYSGLYVDGQFKYSRYNSDLVADSLGSLARNADGAGHAISIEVGQKYQLDSELTLIPQVQLTKSKVDFDTFTGSSGETVALNDAESSLLRIGLEVDQYKSLKDGEQRLYGIANVFHEFNGGTSVDVSGVSLENSGDDWAGEIGIGGNYSWEESYSIYGEVSYATSLQNFGDSKKLSANLGLRMEF